MFAGKNKKVTPGRVSKFETPLLWVRLCMGLGAVVSVTVPLLLQAAFRSLRILSMRWTRMPLWGAVKLENVETHSGF